MCVRRQLAPRGSPATCAPAPHLSLCRSDPGADGGEGGGGGGDSYHLWGGAMLPDELDAKLTLGGGEGGGGGRGSAPPSAPPSLAGDQAQQQQQQQQGGDLASLWGNAQVGGRRTQRLARRLGAGMAPPVLRAPQLAPSPARPGGRATPWLTRRMPPRPALPRLCLQGDRNDPFGSYLAGLRLGTGF